MKFIMEANQLTIKLEGFEQMWALKHRLQIPRHAIVGVDYLAQLPAMQDYKGYLRFPGTSVPWRFLAGSRSQKNRREFWYVHATQPGVLTVQLKPGVVNYDRLRVTCSPEIAQSVADWWRESK